MNKFSTSPIVASFGRVARQEEREQQQKIQRNTQNLIQQLARIKNQGDQLTIMAMLNEQKKNSTWSTKP